MNSKRLKITLGGTATALALALPGGAAAEEYFVPEGNSAVTQYSETFPTAGGDKDAESTKGHTPSKALGHENAKQLEQQGADGAAAAELAAATAPTASAEPEPQPKKGKHKQGGKPGADRGQQSEDAEREAQATPAAVEDDSGSGGFGEVLAKALGLGSPGDLGFLLPLTLLASLAWALVYAARHRQHAAE